MILKRPKTKKGRRVVPLAPALVDALRAHRKSTLADANPHNLVWHDAGRPIQASPDSAAWDKACSDAGVSDVELHGARRTTATLLRAAKVPESVIQDILGHASAEMTRHYQDEDIDLMREAVVSLGEHLAAKKAVSA